MPTTTTQQAALAKGSTRKLKHVQGGVNHASKKYKRQRKCGLNWHNPYDSATLFLMRMLLSAELDAVSGELSLVGKKLACNGFSSSLTTSSKR